MKKEIRENNEARRLLTDEEAEQVAGGAASDVQKVENTESAADVAKSDVGKSANERLQGKC